MTQLNLDGLTTLEVLQNRLKALRLIKDKICFGFSGGDDSTLLLNEAVKILGNDINVVYNNTRVDFKETIKYVNKMVKYWGLQNFHVLYPVKPFNEVVNELGLYGIVKLKNACCRYLKNQPLSNWMHENNIEIAVNGIRWSEGKRSSCYSNTIHYSKYYDIKYYSPMIEMSNTDVDRYFIIHDIPKNPLYELGYIRTGCAPCPCPNKFYDYYSLLQKHHPKWYQYVLKIRNKNKRHMYDKPSNNFYYHKWCTIHG